MQLVSLTLIHWIVIYPVDSTIQLLNNWGQINMYMPSTAAPKPCPTLVQKAGPKIWTIFRQKWLKKILTLLGGTHLFSRTTQANRLPNKHLALLTVRQFLRRPSMFGHFSLLYKAIRASSFYIRSLNLTSQLQGICSLLSSIVTSSTLTVDAGIPFYLVLNL